MEIKSFFKFWALAAFAVTALTFTSCNDDEEDGATSEPTFQTFIDNDLVSAATDEVYNYGGVDYPCVKVAETLQINYSGSGEPEWTCSDESLALVDQNGLVTGIDVGLVTITATVTEEWSETISSIRIYVVEGDIEVVQDDSLITCETEDYYEGCPAVQVEETLQLTYTGEGTPEWKSDTERVASVDQTGLVTGIAVGGPVKITATVTTEATMTISTVELYVIEHAVEEVEDDDLITAETEETAEYEGTSYTAVKVGLTLQLGYSGEGVPEWSVDNEEVAAIDQDGKLTGVSEGLVTVTAVATANYVKTTSTTQICVYIEYVTNDDLLSADTENTADYEGASYPCVRMDRTLQILYSGEGAPEWSVDDEKIATIDQTGKLTGVAEGLVTVSAVTFADGVQTTSSIKICVIPDVREEAVAEFSAVRAMEEGVIDDDNYVYSIEGYIVSDCNSANVRSSIPSHTPWEFDMDVNYRTAYIESKDGTYGFQLEFEDSEENTLERYSEVKVTIDGLTLSKNSSPEFYTLSGLTAGKVDVVSTGATVPSRQKTISELTDSDIFTLVTVQNLEILQKDGTYTNVEETWARLDDNCPYSAGSATNYSFDVVPLMLIDKSGNTINMLTNMGSPWRRPAAYYINYNSSDALFYEVVPQGSGSLTGVVVADEVVTYRYGDCGTYQLRMIEEGDIQFNDAAFTNSICEWTWDDQPSGTSSGNGSFSADPTTGAGELLIPNKNRSDEYQIDNGFYAEYIKDWNNNYTNTNTANNGGRGAATSAGLYVTNRFYDASTQELREGGFIQVSFSTAGISGSNLFLFLAWVGGQTKDNSFLYGANHWHVLYSTDGENFTDALGGAYIDRRLIAYYWDSYKMLFDNVPGHKEYCVPIPASCFNQEKVYVRIVPDEDLITNAIPDTNATDWYTMLSHAKQTVPTSQTSTNAQACMIGTIAIRYF